MIDSQWLLIGRLRAAVREFNNVLPTLNAKAQEYATKNQERYTLVSPEVEIDEEAWSAAPLKDIKEKLEEIKKRHGANEKKVIRLDKLLNHPKE